MKAQELRIGNLVNVPNKEQSPFRIDYFDENKVYQNQGFYNTEFGLVPYHPLTWDISDCAPIPLTPEILEKCGLERTGNLNPIASRKFYKIGRIIIEHIAGDRIAVYVDSPLEDILIGYQDHLHQLQNLYYSLTEEEQNYKP